MEKKQKEQPNPKRKDRFEAWMLFGVAPLFICSHYAWMIAMILENPLLKRIMWPIFITMIVLMGIFLLIYFIRRPQILYGIAVAHPVVNRCSQILMYVYLVSLFLLVVAYTVIPETMTWTIAFLPALCILIFIGVNLHFYRLYRGDRIESLSESKWEKYTAFVLASETINTWFMLTLAVHVLNQVMGLMASERLCFWFWLLYSFMWLMMPVWILLELFRLSHRHEQIMQSHPKIDRFSRTYLGTEGVAAVFLLPLIKKLLYSQLPAITADGIFLTISLVLALVIVGTVIYFKVYKAKYIKASTLSW